MSATGLLTGVLTLAAVEVGLSSPWATRALGSTADGISAGVNRLMSPDVGLVPNLHDDGNTTSTTSSSSSAAPSATPSTTQRKQAHSLVQLNKRATTAKPTPKGRKPKLARTVKQQERHNLRQILLGLSPSS